MVRMTKKETTFFCLLADQRHRSLQNLVNSSRACPATQHRLPDNQTVCSKCDEKVCERMQAKGLDDQGKALPIRDRPFCGAKTRTGGTCSHKVIPGKIRCRYHGGKSTGPKTNEGRARIAEAQRKRWANQKGNQDL